MSTPAAGGSAVAFPFNFDGTTPLTSTVLVTGGVTNDTAENVPQGTPTSTAEIYTYTPNISIFYPKYQLVSIMYAPPGNASNTGFTTTTTDGTTSTFGSSFQDANNITLSEKFKVFKVGGGATQTFGFTVSHSNSHAFTETFTDATGISNISHSDPIDHNNDAFYLWLNPELQITLNGSTPVTYSVAVHGEQGANIIPVQAGVLKPNALGNTTVPLSTLQPISLPGTPPVQLAGLASICAHLIASEYATSSCTMADQCGCQPSDFAPILAQDPLIGQSGTIDPRKVDGAGITACMNPTEGTDCRYVSIPESVDLYVAGPDAVGYNSDGDTVMESDSNSTATTLGGMTSLSVGGSFQIGGPGLTFSEGNTFTWTQSQSVGITTGSGNSQSASLLSSTVGCRKDVSLYEDTVYHTFLFQDPTNVTSCGPDEVADISLSISPQTVVAGGTVTLTATVTASAGGPPTGTVQFLSGTTVIGTASLNSVGVATLRESTNGVPSGSYSATANYLGSSAFSAALSPAVTLNVISGPSSPLTLASPELATSMNGNMADSITVTDFNNDGNVDVAVAYFEDNAVRVILNPGGQTTLYPVGKAPYDVVSGDLNGDGYPDLVSVNTDDNTVSVLLNNGKSSPGTFAAAVAYPVGSYPFQVAIGDLNGDGIPDLAVTNNVGNTVSILYGAGNGTFVAGPTLNTGTQPYGIVIGDFARTGHNDIAVTCYSTSQMYVFPNNGNGTFGSPSIYTTDSNPAGLVVGDFNGDGRLDIVTGNTIANDVSFFAGNGDGTFQSGVISIAYNFPSSIAAGDLNGDGIPDLVTVSANANAVTVNLGNGDGTFQTRQNYAAGTYPWAVALGDFNNDGKLDIVTANTYNRVNITNVTYQYRYVQQYPPVNGGEPSAYVILNTTGTQ